MGIGKYINGVYHKAIGAVEYASRNEVKGMQTFDEGAEKTSVEMARFYESAHMEAYPGSREAMRYVDDVITQKRLMWVALWEISTKKLKISSIYSIVRIV